MLQILRHQRVPWCNRSVEWTAIALDGAGEPGPRNAMWSYALDELTYFGFPFDPMEAPATTAQRAVNWLNRHHFLLRRELIADPHVR